MAKQPTQEEQEILGKAKAFFGRIWRNDIHVAWMQGNYKGFPDSHHLQRMRNNPEREWNISTVKLKNAVK